MLDGKTATREQFGSRIGLGAAIQFVGMITQQLLRFMSNWLIAHLFGPTVMGLYSLGFITWSAVEMSFSGGLLRAVMRRLPHHLARDEHSEARGVVHLSLYCSALGGLALGALFYLLADVIAVHLLKKPEVAPLLRIFALVIPLDAVSTVVWATARSLGSFTFIFYQFMLLPALVVAFILVVALLQGDGRMLAAALLAAYLVPLAPLLVYHSRLTRFLRAVNPRLLWAPFLAFAGINMLSWLADFGYRNIDLMLVGRLRTLSEAGIYGVATRNATTCSTVMIAINGFFLPTISSLYSAGRLEDLRDIFRKGTLWILIVGAPLAIFVMAFSEPLMAIFGLRFLSGAWALWLLAGAQLFNQGTGLIASALLMSNRQNSVLVLSLLGIVITFVLCEWLVPVYGLNGAALAMSTSVIVINVVMSLWGWLQLRLSPFSPSYYKPLVAGAVAGIASQFVVQHLPIGDFTQPGAPHVRLAALTIGLGLLLFAPLYAGGMLALGAKTEAKAALKAVRSGMNRRTRPAAEDELEKS